MPYYYGFDWTYIVIVLPCIILSLLSSAQVNNTFKKYANKISRSGITGAQAAQEILKNNNIHNVHIERTKGHLTDHFDPRSNTIRLSDSVYDSCSTAAIGVACHEAGHAMQYANNYFPIQIRSAIIPITNLGSKLAMPLILVGILISTFSEFSFTLVYLGIACFSLSLVFQLITLPVEFNASNRALSAIVNSGILTKDELKGAKKTLTAAAMTYVAATAVALAQLLRLIIIFGRRRSRD